MPLSRFVYDPWELPPEQRRTTFVGREPILERLLAAIREQEGRDTVQHYILTGPRGIGKTTLLLTLRDRIHKCSEISSKWFCVQLREEEYYIHKQRDLWQLVLQALADEEKVTEAQEIVKQAEAIPDDEKSSALLVDGLRSICRRYNKRLALLVDNFGQLFPTTAAGERKHLKSDSEYRAFRKRLSTETFLMLIATSVKLFQDIYAYDKGFFHFFSPVELPELTQDEIIEMLRRSGQADSNNQDFLSRLEKSQVNIRTLSMLTGGNPRLITMLYQILAQREMSEPVQALWETVAGLTPMLRQELADMPRQQSKTLDALLRLNGVAAPAEIAKSSRLPLNVVTTQLGRLKEARYVALEGGGKGKRATYRIADQMFSVWYWMRYVPVARRRIAMFTAFIRTWFSLEERKRLFQERLERFQSYQSRGIAGMARKSLLDAEYYAASFDDPTERGREMERIADAYITAGDLPSAAGLFAELAGTNVKSPRKFESLGYSVLARRLMAKGDSERALESYSEALAKDPHDAETRACFGLALFLSARYAEAIEQFNQLPNRLSLSGTLPSTLLVCRGIARGYLGEPLGALDDFTAVVDLPSTPTEIVAGALLGRGATKRELGDFHGAVADCTLVVDLIGAPTEAVAEALLDRGIAESELGDLQRAIEDYTAAIKLKAAPVAQIARALVNRGFAKGGLGDFQGAIDDYTEVVELRGAPAKYVVLALINRGISRAQRDDAEGAISDYSAVAALPDAPAELVGIAMSLRGRAHSHLDQYEEALADFKLVLEIPGLPEESRVEAILRSGLTHDELGRSEEALGAYTLCARSGILPFVHVGLGSTVLLLLSEKKVDEALAWVRRFYELEPAEVSVETRLEARLDLIRGVATVASLEDVNRLVDALLETDPEELRARLQLLKPGLELARTNDESVLANRPEDERRMAREIARTLAESAHRPADSPLRDAGDTTRDPAVRALRTAKRDMPAPASPDGSPS